MKSSLFFLITSYILSGVSCTIPSMQAAIKADFIVTARNYYVNPINGNNKNDGLSPKNAFKTLYCLQQVRLEPGDTIFLCGKFKNEKLMLKGANGTKEKPIVITSFTKEEKTIINAAGRLCGVLLENCNHIKVENLEITANGGAGEKDWEAKKEKMRCGIIVRTTASGIYEDIVLNNLYVHDIYFESLGFVRDKNDVHTENGVGKYGWGIRFFNTCEEPAILKDLLVSNCRIDDVSHTGIKISSRQAKKGEKNSTYNFEVKNCELNQIGGPGMQFGSCDNGHIHHNKVDHCGSNTDKRKWSRGSGLWTWGANMVIVEYNTFTNANGPADSSSAHIDFNCKDVIMQYNFSMNNSGAFCEILGNNHNCCYRYNVSVNDGIRKNNGAVLWISGYVGANRPKIGPYHTYIYNNTVYVKSELVPTIAYTTTAEGLLVANNIFCLTGGSKWGKGDQFNPEKNNGQMANNVFYLNNLFINAKSWADSLYFNTEDGIYADPQFLNPSGNTVKDYIPTNKSAIDGKGIIIPKLPGDELGLKVGFEVNTDILGQPVDSIPDLGAIMIK